jgi:hypothetical protein
VERRLLARNGVNTDVELALFEADHGSPQRGLALARRAWAAAPSVRSADALGRALTRAGHPAEGLRWAQRALRLGSRDANYLLHAGLAARAAGRSDLARGWLADASGRRGALGPLQAQQARQAGGALVRRRAVAAFALVAAALALTAAPAAAHPLGNFSTNHLTVVRVGAERIDVRYILDLAEIPTFRERDIPAAERLARLRVRVLAASA